MNKSNKNDGVHFRLGSFMRLFLLQKKFSTLKNKRILDVGCNYGEIAQVLALNNRITGVDMDEEALKIANNLVKKAKFIKASATILPFRDNTFDVAICLSVLEHIKDDQQALKEMGRVLKRKGELVLTIPNEKAWLVPTWLEPTIKLVNQVFKTNFPSSEKQYLNFGHEGIGHVRQGYSLKEITKMLSKENLILKFSKTYWHAPSRAAYLLLTPLIKRGYLKENHAKVIFTFFLHLDKIFPDLKGDLLLISEKC